MKPVRFSPIATIISAQLVGTTDVGLDRILRFNRSEMLGLATGVEGKARADIDCKRSWDAGARHTFGRETTASGVFVA